MPAQTYIDAQRIVTALDRAQQDPGYFDTATEILNSYVEPERSLVVNKAIALGADPDIVRALLVKGEGEVIEITSSGPVIKRARPKWALVGASIVGLLIGAFTYRK